MRGLECAFWGVLGKDPELKTSKGGAPYTGMNIAVTVGKSDDGKDVSQWVRATCFGEVAERIAARAKKGDRVYIEGTLTMTQWNDWHGEVRHGLNVAAWKAEKVAWIGKNRERRSGADHDDIGGAERKPASKRGGYEFDDELTFLPAGRPQFD